MIDAYFIFIYTFIYTVQALCQFQYTESSYYLDHFMQKNGKIIYIKQQFFQQYVKKRTLINYFCALINLFCPLIN
jgi:hypothetical protein